MARNYVIVTLCRAYTDKIPHDQQPIHEHNLLTDVAARHETLRHNNMVRSVDCRRGGVAFVFQTAVQALVEFILQPAKPTTQSTVVLTP